MPREEKSIHYIYKTTCNITGRYYIGMHSTSNIDDGYMGSGKRLRNSIRKHGKDNHKIEILELLSDREKLIERERELITSEMLCDDQCMNIMSGGTGGFISVEQQKYRSECGGKAHANKIQNDSEYRLILGIRASKIWKRLHKEGKIKYDTNTGKKYSDEHKRKIGEANSIKQKGSLNSQFGSMWITDGISNKKIKNSEEIYIGWVRGRTQNPISLKNLR